MNKLFTLMCCLMALALSLEAQTGELHVITKRLEKSFSYQPGYELNVEGEKAEVAIETWDRPEISILIEFTAKHPEKAVATVDVEKIRYLAERVRNKIYVRNYVSTKEGEAPPKSNLQARYTIKVPESCPVYLKNYFGTANVINLAKSFRFQGEFSAIGMENISGTIDLMSRFGDISGQQLDGQVSISARRSDIALEDIRGSYNIEAEYSDIRILPALAGLLDLNIKAEHSQVFLYGNQLLEYGYALTAQHGQIVFPSDLRLAFLQNTDALKKVTFQPRQEYYPHVTISVTFGDIYLEKERPNKR